MRRFRTGNVEFHVCIFLPVSKQKRKLEEESIVGITKRRKGLWAGVTVETTLERFAALDQVLPIFKVVRVGLLQGLLASAMLIKADKTYNKGIVFAHRCVLLFGAAICAKVAHDCGN